MGMFGPKPGTWWVSSKSDPRWDASGRCAMLVSGGRPKEVDEHIEAKRALLGDPPDDLECGAMKD